MAYSIIVTTCPDEIQADTLARKILQEGLTACIQSSPIKSYYTWKGEPHIDPEIRLMMKTKTKLYSKIERFIKKHHPYDVPQIISIPIEKGAADYLAWIDAAVK